MKSSRKNIKPLSRRENRRVWAEAIRDSIAAIKWKWAEPESVGPWTKAHAAEYRRALKEICVLIRTAGRN